MPDIKAKITPIIGLQWGDEGKGKGVARIASNLKKEDLIVRFQGGNNAGHTIWNKGICYVFHLIPSGVFGRAQIHLGAGMVINPGALLEEAKMIPKNVSFEKRMTISPHAVLTMPTHILLDSVSERTKGKRKIGSTGRGISPSYTDLTLRRALRVGDIFFGDFKKKYEDLRREHIETLEKVFGYKVIASDLRVNDENFWAGIKFIKKFGIVNSNEIVLKALNGNHKVIAEGAQGALLDVRFGHYPFVTASHTISSGVGTGLGIPPYLVGGAVGIFKAYTTKVGEGPFPTELGGEVSSVWCRDKKIADEKIKFPNPNPNSESAWEQGVALRRLGNEVGATTGRLRRTGWLDIPLLKYAIDMNHATELVLTKLDVLNGFKELKVCTGYKIGGKIISSLPFDLSRTKVDPVYQSFPIWKGNLADYGNKLPKEALGYVKFLEKILGAKIIYVGTGVEEHHVVERYW
jgi:adenylosuccinate synthase